MREHANFGIRTCVILSASHIIMMWETPRKFQDIPGPGNCTQKNPELSRSSISKLTNGIAIELHRAGKNPVDGNNDTL